MTGPCPPVKHLRRLLADELTAAEEEALDEHLLRCTACRDALESLTASGPAADHPRATDAPAPDPEWLRRLKTVAGSLAHPGVPADEPRPLPSVPGYEILGELGRGGMGVVYRARQVGLNRVVALKMILGGAFATGKSLERFRAEALAVARLQHPNIVQIFETGEVGGLPYFSQEYVEGGSLAAQLDGTAPAPDRAAELCARLARAVQFAHDRGVVHRDLKPANVLLTLDGVPKIADFGLAKNLEDHAAAGTSASEAGVLLGTPRYMAPEQLGSSAPGSSRPPVGPACDVYALGVILYELLTGRPLYTGDTPLDVLVRVLHEDPRPPRAHSPGVPRDLELICLKCLAKAPGGRYASARELADDLHRFLLGEPVRARPPSVLDRSGKFIRRNKALVGAAAGIAVALTAGIVATSLTALSEARQRRLADASAHQAGLARQEAVREACQARMAAALAALGGNNVREAADQLDAVPPDRRGWEWRYASARLDDSIAVLRDAGRELFPCPNADRFVSITDQGVRLWSIDGGRPSAPLTPDVPKSVLAAQNAAGGLMLAVHYRSLFCVLGEDGRVRLRLPVPSAHDVHAWAFDPACTRLACAWIADRGDRDFALFDLTDGRRLARFDPVSEEFRCIAFSPDGRRLVTTTDDGRVRVWDATGGAPLHAFTGHTAQINAATFRPDGRVVLSCSVDQTFRQWDLASGKVIDERYGHEGPVNVAAYSPDGRWIASGGTDGTIRYWSAAGGPAVTVLHGHTAPVFRLAFSPDGRRVLSVSRDSTGTRWDARVWDGPGLGDPRTLRDHTVGVYPVAYSPDGRTIASGAWDREIHLRDAATGQTRAVLRGHAHYVAALAFSPDNRWLISRSGDKTIRIWDLATGEPRVVLPHIGLGLADCPHEIAVTPDGKHFVSPIGTALHFWTLPEGREAGTWHLPSDSARAIQYSPDGRRVAVVDNSPNVPVFDARTGEVHVWLRGHHARVNRVAFSPDGSSLVSAGNDGTVRLWDPATGTCLRIFRGHTDEVFAAVFHPTGNRIASAGRDRVIRIWDPAHDMELARLPGHTNYVFSLAFSPDGSSLVSGSGDCTVRLWDAFPVSRRLQARAVVSR
jgi:WD40 repeat protein